MGHHEGCKVTNLIIPIEINIGEFPMAPQNLQIFVTLTINPPAAPPPPPLVSVPASSASTPMVLPAEQSGVAVAAQPIAQVQGGTPPYLTPTIDPASPSQLPAGMTLGLDANGNLTISGTPPVVAAPTTGTFIVDVVDSGT
jgi:hypothetical protein